MQYFLLILSIFLALFCFLYMWQYFIFIFKPDGHEQAFNARWKNIGYFLLTIPFFYGSIVFVLAMVGYVRSEASAPPPQQTQEHCDSSDGYTARVKAKEHVRSLLRAPRTAKFSRLTAEQVAQCTYLVRGHVDAQNGFGALIRNYFVVNVKRNDNSNFVVTGQNIQNSPL